jgi:tetratricopeptide (TPR) repeat protein
MPGGVGGQRCEPLPTRLKEIWQILVDKQYHFKSFSTSWTENVNTWLSQAILTNSIGVKHHLPARLYYNIGEYECSVKHCEYGISIAQKENNQITFYSELGNLGMAFNALGRYKEAKSCLEESVKACHDIENVQGEIAQLQSLGNVYRNLGEFDAAIKVYMKAVTLAEKEDIGGLCTSLGNLASIFTQTEQPDEAIKCLEQGLKIALDIGNKQSEGSMLCCLGIAYFQSGKIEKANQFIQESIKTTRAIGDKQGECMALLNISNVNLQEENFDQCLINATSSLVIAQTIGIRQSEAGANYNIGSSYFFKGESKSAISYLKKAVEIYSDIYGVGHRHTQAAMKSLFRAERYPEYNKMTKMNLL